MKSSVIKLFLLTNVCASAHLARGDSPDFRTLSTESHLRARCDISGNDVFTVWTGTVYATLPNERTQILFDISGMNVARCYKNSKGEWLFVSRELSYYLDPKSGEPVQKWTNPWTNEIVPVVHVANNPVQINYGLRSYSGYLVNGSVSFRLDGPLFYPNVLAGDSRFEEYSSQQNYQAFELFKLTSPLESVLPGEKAMDSGPLDIGWTRIGPWLPWMKMKDKAGQLVYSAVGKKVASFAELPEFMKREIEQRIPLYKTALKCWLNSRNDTSWTYFAKVFDAYLRGETFPVEAPRIDDICNPDQLPISTGPIITRIAR